MSQQQTVLRVQTNIPSQTLTGTTEFIVLDLYTDIPIKLNKSYAELQDIAKRNSDYSIGVTLPGTKKNNQFFESFFNVDAQSLFFDATKRQLADVLLGDEPLFRGYLRLNKVSVLESKVEYDITLYSRVADLFGQIGNNLMVDLDYNDNQYQMNHIFDLRTVISNYETTNFALDQEKPYPYLYPIVHNGYLNTEVSGSAVPFVSGGTAEQMVGLYTSVSPISAYTSYSAFTAATVSTAGINTNYSINSPFKGIYDNQLKPALSVWYLVNLIFKQYGYTIKSDFMNTPWMKSLYMYGYFSSDSTKFGFKLNKVYEYPIEGVQVTFHQNTFTPNGVDVIVSKLGTGVPCYCTEPIDVELTFQGVMVLGQNTFTETLTIPPLTSGATLQNQVFPLLYGTAECATASSTSLKYFPKAVGSTVLYEDADFIDLSLVMDGNIKQIDFLSSIAKKFNLVFIPDPDVPNQMIIEPFDFYIGTGNIYDWTEKLSFDKGFTVEPALNFVESNLILTDLEDGDEGNILFKKSNNKIYGENQVYNPTDFKSTEKKIDTIFSPELIRKWDNNIGLPLGINYVAANQASNVDNVVRWVYKGIKTKPKLFFWLGGFNPFIDKYDEVYNGLNNFTTYQCYIKNSDGNDSTKLNSIPVISHTMPMGLSDEYKINNDSLCILFNSEEPTDIGVQTFNTFTQNDMYLTFYSGRINNIYDPNTRFLVGYFDLKYSDILNLKPNDVVKINEQYFIINKISEFNLTSREMTKVELLQYNVNPSEYPERYFFYKYCDAATIYKFQTDFTEPNLLDTNYGWSIYYDYQVGTLSGQTSGFTSTFYDFQPGPSYVPYSMWEVDADTYAVSGSNWTNDSLRNHIYNTSNGVFEDSMPKFWYSSGSNYVGTNVFYSCSDFSTKAATYGIITGSSTYH